jgi:hypothetical protein
VITDGPRSQHASLSYLLAASSAVSNVPSHSRTPLCGSRISAEYLPLGRLLHAPCTSAPSPRPPPPLSSCHYRQPSPRASWHCSATDAPRGTYAAPPLLQHRHRRQPWWPEEPVPTRSSQKTRTSLRITIVSAGSCLIFSTNLLIVVPSNIGPQ